MNITMIIISAAVVAVVGIIVGFGLGIFGEKFKVEIDERQIAIREELPGNNCGGCGYPGCDGLAKAINEGKAPANKCPVGGAKVGQRIAEILGHEVEDNVHMVAFVKCKGTCDAIKTKDIYFGIKDCGKAYSVPGRAEKSCVYGCMGFGSCVRVCKFDAIHVTDGIAVVDKEKCKGCGVCVQACPNKLIELVPYEAKHLVRCSSQDKGKRVREVCSVGCIGCTLCTKQCETNAITMNGNVAVIDYSKCTGCGACAEKCPAKVIV